MIQLTNYYIIFAVEKKKNINKKTYIFKNTTAMKKILLVAIMAMLTVASYAHKRVLNAVPVSNDTIYYNVDNIRVDDKSDAAYGRLLLTAGKGVDKRDIFRDFYPNGTLKAEGGYSFIDLSNDNNTQLEGEVTAFYPNGKEKWQGKFVNGKANGYFTVMMRDGSIATAQFVNGKSKLDYFVVTAADGTMSKRDVKDLKHLLKR